VLPYKLVFHERYDLNLGEHVFPSKKYTWLKDRLLRTRFASPEDFVAPRPATDDDIRLVHDEEWVAKLRGGTLSYQDILRLEIPYSRQMVEAFWLAAGGSMLTAKLALRDGVAFNIGGGFHHAFPGHGEGFCAVNDIAIAIRALQKEGSIRRAMVVDVDVHHGNGTAAVFACDDSVFTLSIHQENNYPSEKPPSSLDIHLPDGIEDAEYVHRLGNGYRAALAMFRPELVLYVAGADPYQEDQLGGLNLTFDGLRERDRLVLWTALSHGIPVAIVLAGGYAQSVEDTITIHANTAAVAKEVLLGVTDGKRWESSSHPARER
jgi:acetoin utilization deacetylase AcuC-like enzyme